MSKVSVIIPVYNVEDYLTECLESVMNQSLKDIEIICIDDASQDASVKKLEELAKKDHRIKVYKNSKNQGLSFTRNRGIDLASSKFIYFLDSDDAIELNMLEELYDMAQKEYLDVIYFDAKVIYMTDRLEKEHIGYRTTRNYTYEEIYQGQDLFSQFMKNDDFAVSVCRQFYRLDFIRKHSFKFYEGMLHEDNLFTFCTILKANRTACINQRYFKRRFREDSIMTASVTMKNVEGMFNAYYEILKIWEEEKPDYSISNEINAFLIALFRRAKHLYSQIPYKNRQVPIFINEEYKRNLFFNSIVAAENNCVLLNGISIDKMNKIAKAKMIIIYGAGTIGKDVLRILDHNKIDVFAFAVTSLKNNPDCILRVPVKELKDFGDDEREALFIIAVSQTYEAEMIDLLKGLGYKNYITVHD